MIDLGESEEHVVVAVVRHAKDGSVDDEIKGMLGELEVVVVKSADGGSVLVLAKFVR